VGLERASLATHQTLSLEVAQKLWTPDKLTSSGKLSPTWEVVVTSLLARSIEDGAVLRYRGDFDWPGVAIANRVFTDFGAVPWRMGRADYEAALAGAGRGLADLPELEGRPVEAVWDAELTLSMKRAGKSVHEEALLDILVADLTEGILSPQL